MANKQALRELQSRLADRLQAARTQERATSWLAVESAGRRFLLPLQQAGEIFSPVPVVSVPHTQPWFLGVANLRGGLFGVVDLARFLGLRSGEAESPRDQSRLVVFNPALDLNCALLVDRLAGLRSADQLHAETAVPGAPRPAFAGLRYRDAAGLAWQELDLAALAVDDAFVKIVGS
jgi:twitching motility protein PilI